MVVQKPARSYHKENTAVSYPLHANIPDAGFGTGRNACPA